MLEITPMTLKEANAYVASLRAAGWKCVGQAGGLRWTGKRRPEVDLYPAQMKIRFEQTVEGPT